MSAPADTIRQLNSARDIVLKDANIYPQVVPGVLPVIGTSTPVEQRRWGADFLAETFASPVVNADDKQKMCIDSGMLDTLKGYLNRKEEVGEDEDPAVVKSAVQCAASVYPLVFRHTMNTSNDEAWKKMAAIKVSILRRMDTAPFGVRICCVKFVAMIVQVQTPGLIADPRRQEQNEVSLALVPRDHAVLKVGNLEAEASGLLDRLLYVLQEDAVDALLVTATLNALAFLVQRRASISNKILGTVLNFNPLKLASRGPMSGRDKIAVRSMTRTTMTFLLHVLKRNPHHTLAGRLQQHVERLRHSLMQAFTDANQLKRPASDDPTDGLDDAKRQRVDAATAAGSPVSPQQSIQASTQIPRGSTVAQLFTLSEDKAATSFDVAAIPYNIVAQLIPPLMQSVDQALFDQAINIVKSRYLNLSKQPPADATAAAKAAIGDDEDDYDPSMTMGGDAEQVLNGLDQMPPESFEGPGIAIGPFQLPPPAPLNDREKDEYSKTAVTRVFETLSEMDREARQKGAKKQEVAKGFNRAALPSHERDAWIHLVTRLATRSQFELKDGEDPVKQENGDRSLAKKGEGFSLSTGIREALLNYVMENFRARITVAISWLNEEWYCDRVSQKQNGTVDAEDASATYNTYTLRLLDSLIPYLDTKDNRVLIRLVSEIPSLPAELFPKLRKIADDPERVNLVVQALLYLVMFRPPAREQALDALEALWKENEDARKPAERHLAKWRPEVVEKGIEENAEVKAEA